MGDVHESRNPRLADIRVWAVKGFRNHLVFYRPIEEGIEVLTVLHGARNLDTALADEVD
jgi:toxin ParE1/3/4